jgi:hypothetical protein
MKLTPQKIEAIARATGRSLEKTRSLIQDNQEEVAAELAKGAEQERERWRGIEAVAADLPPSFDAVVKAMKADGRYTGLDLARLAVTQMRLGRPAQPVNINSDLAQKNAVSAWAASPETRRAFSNDQATFNAFYQATADHNASQKVGV